ARPGDDEGGSGAGDAGLARRADPADFGLGQLRTVALSARLSKIFFPHLVAEARFGIVMPLEREEFLEVRIGRFDLINTGVQPVSRPRKITLVLGDRGSRSPAAPIKRNGRLETNFQKFGMPKMTPSSASWC